MKARPIWLLALAACTNPPPPKPQPAPPPVQAPTPSVAPVASTPAPAPSPPIASTGDALLAPAAGKAPWKVETPLAVTPEGIVLEEQIVAIGERSALVHTDVGVFIVSRDGVIAGPLVLPEPLGEGEPVVGFGRNDEIIFVGDSGQLYSAKSHDVAMKPRGKIAGATSWDIAGTTVVAAKDDTAFISLNGGRSFQRSKPDPKKEIEAIVGRPDGVVVASTTDGLRISKKAGRWKDSLLHGHPRRIGSWISICGFVLTSDGRHWVSEPWPEHDQLAWRLPFVVSNEASGLAMPRLFTLTEPPVPKTPPGIGDELIGVGCSGPIGPRMIGKAGRMPIVSGVFSPYGLKRIQGTFGPRTEETTTELAFFANGACAKKDALGRNEDYRCKENATLSRPPQLLAYRHGETEDNATALAAPKNCQARHAVNAHGVALITCATDNGLGVELATGSGLVKHETDLRLAGEGYPDVMVSSDGTLAAGYVTKDRDMPALLVRQPRPFGDAEAWRSVDVEGALAYRVGYDGAVLAIVAEPKAETFSVVLAAAGQAPKVIAKDVLVRGGLADFAIDDERRVVLHQDTMAGKRVMLVVSKTGTVFAPEG